MLLSIAEIINELPKLKKEEEKIEWLKKYDCASLRTILRFTYDKDNVEFLVPSTAPPWKKNGYVGVEGMLHKEARRLRIFVKGGGYDNLSQVKREHLFISLLEDIDDKDAEILCKMIQQKPFKGLSKKLVMKVFPEDYAHIKK